MLIRPAGTHRRRAHRLTNAANGTYGNLHARHGGMGREHGVPHRDVETRSARVSTRAGGRSRSAEGAATPTLYVRMMRRRRAAVPPRRTSNENLACSTPATARGDRRTVAASFVTDRRIDSSRARRHSRWHRAGPWRRARYLDVGVVARGSRARRKAEAAQRLSPGDQPRLPRARTRRAKDGPTWPPGTRRSSTPQPRVLRAATVSGA